MTSHYIKLLAEQVPHPELVAGEMEFGLAWFRRMAGSQFAPDEAGGIRILSPGRLFRSGRIRENLETGYQIA